MWILDKGVWKSVNIPRYHEIRGVLQDGLERSEGAELKEVRLGKAVGKGAKSMSRMMQLNIVEI